MSLITVDDLKNHKEFLSVTEASIALNMNKKTVLKLFKNGEIGAYKNGVKYMTTKRAIVDYINSCAIKNAKKKVKNEMV